MGIPLALVVLVVGLVVFLAGSLPGEESSPPDATAASPQKSEAPSTRPTNAPRPKGPDGTWNLAFEDDFDGSAVDRRKWAGTSSSQADDGQGNKDNEQLEWNQDDNCSVADGRLTITAKPDDIVAPSGEQYDWSSCLLTTVPSYSFQYGYMETRAKFPPQKGFWPAFWTWQTPGSDEVIETDAYEYYSDNRRRLYLTQQSGEGGGCELDVDFRPSRGFHTYGVDIKETGTDFYIDGELVCTAEGTSTGATNIIVNMAVYARIPPEPGTEAVTQIDYVRAWQR